MLSEKHLTPRHTNGIKTLIILFILNFSYREVLQIPLCLHLLLPPISALKVQK